jgi:hypothetical protein
MTYFDQHEEVSHLQQFALVVLLRKLGLILVPQFK